MIPDMFIKYGGSRYIRNMFYLKSPPTYWMGMKQHGIVCPIDSSDGREKTLNKFLLELNKALNSALGTTNIDYTKSSSK